MAADPQEATHFDDGEVGFVVGAQNDVIECADFLCFMAISPL